MFRHDPHVGEDPRSGGSPFLVELLCRPSPILRVVGGMPLGNRDADRGGSRGGRK